jgi:uncharacterized protein YciW
LANSKMIARLADLREFAELKTHFEERQEADVARLGQKYFASPQDWDREEAIRLKAFYAGAAAVLALPLQARRDNIRQEGQA